MKGFQIAASAKAFRILSSNLYKNKIRAIIRELSCNAVDGHIANGNKGMFDVTLPGMLDPQFKIRDYGCGMDDDTIMNLYTTYFASTKSDSNDYIGALGLGSKSPFSYTDSFTVVSYFNGTRRAYAAFIKDGEPTITKVSEAETDEPNGIEITVPVNPQDCAKWKEEARYVFTSFGEIRPKTSLPVDFLPHDKNQFEVKNSVHGAGVFAIMGNIVYPLPAEMWNQMMISMSMTNQNTWSRGNQSAFYIRFNLGELDITPSREELSLDDDTIQAIKDCIKKTDDVMSKDLIDEVAEADDIRDLRDHILKKYNSNYWSYIIRSGQTFKMKNGKSVADEEETRTKFERPTYKETDTTGKVHVMDVPIYRYDLSLTSPRGKKLDTWQTNRLAEYGNHSKIDLFINDKKSSAIRTMKGLKTLGKTFNSNMYMVDVAYADITIKAFQKCWPEARLHIFYSSKCDDARKVNPTAKKATVKKAPNTVNVTQTTTTPTAMYAEDIRSAKGFWIPMYNNEYVSREYQHAGACSLNTIRIFMREKKITEIPVIKSSHWKQVDKNPNMIEVWDEMLKLVIDMRSKMTIDIFPYDNRNNNIIHCLRRNPSTVQLADKLCKHTAATDTFTLFRDVLTHLGQFKHLPTYKKNEKVLKEMLTEYEKLIKLAEQEGKKALDKFCDDNRLIVFYIQRTYGNIEQKMVDEINRVIKL